MLAVARAKGYPKARKRKRERTRETKTREASTHRGGRKSERDGVRGTGMGVGSKSGVQTTREGEGDEGGPWLSFFPPPLLLAVLLAGPTAFSTLASQPSSSAPPSSASLVLAICARGFRPRLLRLPLPKIPLARVPVPVPVADPNPGSPKGLEALGVPLCEAAVGHGLLVGGQLRPIGDARGRAVAARGERGEGKGGVGG